jgi:hypothetical protein
MYCEVAMARCKNCGSQIEDNSSVCSVCGQINPIKQKKVKTVDITTRLEQDKVDFSAYRPKSRKIAVLLFCLVGFSGAPYFYLADKAKAYISILSSVIFIASAILLGVFVLGDLLLPLLIVIGALYAINIFIGLRYLTHHDIKDGQGEFLV